MIISGGDVLMFNVTLTKLILKCFAEGGGDRVGGGGDKYTFPMYNIPLNLMFLACKKVFLCCRHLYSLLRR